MINLKTDAWIWMKLWEYGKAYGLSEPYVQSKNSRGVKFLTSIVHLILFDLKVTQFGIGIQGLQTDLND